MSVRNYYSDMPMSLLFGSRMVPGDYVLQVIVTDKLAKEKNRVATQWQDFVIEP